MSAPGPAGDADDVHALALLICQGMNVSPTQKRTLYRAGGAREDRYLDLVMPAAELISQCYERRAACG